MFRLFSGSAAIRMAGAGAQLLLTIAVVRLCGQYQAGLFFFGFSLLVILSTVARLGSELSGLRAAAALHSAGRSPDLKEAVNTRLFLVLVGGLGLGLLLALFAPTLAQRTYGDEALSVLWLVAAAIPPFAIVGLLSEILKGVGRVWLAITFQNLAIPSVSVATMLAVNEYIPLDARTCSIVLLCTAWVVALGASVLWIIIYRQQANHVERGLAISLATLRRIIMEAPSLLTVSLTSVAMQWIGAVLLGFLAPPADVAGYSVAMRISIAVSIIHSAAASVAGPRMSIAHARGDLRGLQRVSYQTCALIAAITWPGLLFMITFAPLCMAVFGSDYVGFSNVLRVLLAGQLIAALIGHSGMVLVMAGEYSAARLNSITAALSLVALSAVLIPSEGSFGAAIAMSGAVTVGHLTGLFLVRRTLRIWTVPVTKQDFRLLIRRTEEDYLAR